MTAYGAYDNQVTGDYENLYFHHVNKNNNII